jgi:hypothetical protein
MTNTGLSTGGCQPATPPLDQRLRFAEADATAQHALFEDTLAGESTLLEGAEVTRPAIEEHFVISSS